MSDESRLTPEGEAWEITLDLAENGPYIGHMQQCALCFISPYGNVMNLEHHDSKCPWKRARELKQKAAE